MAVKDIILVCLAVIAIPCAEWLITQIYSYSSRGWKSKIEVQAGLVSGRNSPWFTDANLSLCPHSRRDKGVIWGPSCKGTDPID